jgi:predicted dehydrogenase
VSLHIGLIGCGDWGRHILRDLVSLGAHVHVVARTDATCRRALEQGAATGQTDEATLPASLDGYVVATPSATHASIVERLLPSGKPIFVEKPMTCDVASSRRIAEAGRGRVFVMDKWRYHPGIEALASVARSGEIAERAKMNGKVIVS